MSKKTIYLSVAILTGIFASGLFLYFFLIKSLPDISATNRLNILEEQVKVVKDSWGIPHIYAEIIEIYIESLAI